MVRAVLIAALLSGWSASSAIAQSQPSQYFPETGHTVTGEFLNFFSARGGLRIFGYPITDAFDWNGRRVQYFQRVRMELHPENPFPYRVQLGLLGDELGHRDPQRAAPMPSNLFQRYFSETGHSVRYAFLNFYDRNGGLDIFGYPITEFITENNRIVQYFQRARMEWHPELSGDQRVQLGDLGTIHFEVARFDPSLRLARVSAIPGATQTPPISLHVTASVRSPITASTGAQALYVYVTDQTNKPIPNASVAFTVRNSLGARDFSMPQTDVNGYTSYEFDIGNSTPGQIVVIEVRAALGGLSASAQTSFLPWY
jgi:hypothetical protein